MQVELEQVYDQLAAVFPPRSISGEGVRKSLRILEEITGPMRRMEIETGSTIGDWISPHEIVVRQAYAIDPNGVRRWDVLKEPLSLLGYSQPFHGTVSRAELDGHLHSDPARPDVTPYCTSYWDKRWGFCLPHTERLGLPDGDYRVYIDVEHIHGSMTLAQLVIPGETNRECLLTSYLCHPGVLAQNENSGPLVLAFLARAIRAWPTRRYKYRIAFIPETVGAQAFLDYPMNYAICADTLGDHLRQWCDFGYVLTCLGRGDFTYKRSRNGRTIADRAAEHVLNRRVRTHDDVRSFRDYFVDRGSDELSFNSLGFQLPVGSVMRDQYGEYETYHASSDDKSNINFEKLAESVAVYEQILQAAEMNHTYRSLVTRGVPQLGRRGLYSPEDVHPMLALTQFCDGTTDLLTIAKRCDLPIERLHNAAQRAMAAGVIGP